MQTLDLTAFQIFLNQQMRERRLKRSTAADYLRKMEMLKDSLPEEFSCKELAERIVYLSQRSARGKGCGTQAAKYVKAIKKYEAGVLHQQGALLYGSELSALYKKEPLSKVVELRHEIETYNRKINGISRKHQNMKLALRLQMKSGLRVFELAKLKAEHLHTLEDGTLQIQVFGGKGNQNRLVTVLRDSWLEEQVKEYLASNREGTLFHKATAIERFAKGIDIKTHELRKVYARLLYQQLRKEGHTMAHARKEVGIQLGHTGPGAGTVTNRYLGKEWEYGRAKETKK